MLSPMLRSKERLEAVIANVVARSAPKQLPAAMLRAERGVNRPIKLHRRSGDTLITHFLAEFDVQRALFWLNAFKRGFCLTFCSNATVEREFHNVNAGQEPTLETLVASSGEPCVVAHFNPQRCADMLTLPDERDEFCRLMQLLSALLTAVQKSTVGSYVHPHLDGTHTWTFARATLLVSMQFTAGCFTLHDRDGVFARRLYLCYEDAQRLLARACECNVLGIGLATASVPLRAPLVFLLHKTIELSVASVDCAGSIPTAFTLTIDDFLWLTDCLKLFVSQRRYVLTIRAEQTCVCSSRVDAEAARAARRVLASLPT